MGAQVQGTFAQKVQRALDGFCFLDLPSGSVDLKVLGSLFEDQIGRRRFFSRNRCGDHDRGQFQRLAAKEWSAKGAVPLHAAIPFWILLPKH
jgi:hypothetical protein